MLTKSHFFKPEDVDVKNGKVTGYFAAFGNVDSHGDVIYPGAFKKTIRERGPKGSQQIKHLLQHDARHIIGVIEELEEDAVGLKFCSQMIVGIKEAEDTMLRYEAGAFNEHSIGYRPIKGEPIEADTTLGPHRALRELKLWEGSTVTWGSNDQTPFDGFKSHGAFDKIHTLAQRMESVQAQLRVGGMHDNTYKELEQNLTSLEQAIAEVKNNLEPESTTPPADNSALTFFEKLNV